MLAIKMRFLAGRFHATPWGHHVNEGAVEYPPSNFRLLRSLVATFYRTFAAEAHENSAAVERLKGILHKLAAPPEFALPPASIAHTRHYDQANGGVKFFDTFVAVEKNAELIWLWRDVEVNPEEREFLSKLLENLGTFGRSESLCEAELLSEDETAEIVKRENLFKSAPLQHGEDLCDKETFRLLLPKPKDADDLYRILLTETGKMRSKDKQLEPTGTQWITYTRPQSILTARKSAPKLTKRHRPITVARFALSSTVLPLVTDAIIFADKARVALCSSINRPDNTHSPAFIGKDWDETAQKWMPMKNHLHAHFFVTDEDGDGKLDHLTIFAEGTFIDADIKAFGNIRKVDRHYKNLPATNLILIGLGNKESFGEIPIFRKSRIWRSVTPFSLPYFPNRGSGKPPRPRDLPEGQLKRELANRGLPLPIRIERTEYYETEKRPPVRWLEFHDERLRKGQKGNGLYGFEIEFPEEVEGAISLGFGCHFGLGLFLPVSIKNSPPSPHE